MKTFLTLTVLLGLLALSSVLGYWVWKELEDVEMSHHGWIALTLGVVMTFLVGAGLMALVFFSHRRGYDDRANRFDD
jgi:NADH:ubiquinone oxidoreductase subunit 5 (subunit L)/multisubunit Na+/H+ antiporter MnhA subunit